MRWMKFNAVGALGMVVHVGLLGFFVHVLGLHYLLATALSVEAAVLHNFVWHIRWTWADRRGFVLPALGITLLRFNLTNGLVSQAGNLFFMRLLAGAAGIGPVVATLLSIVPCALANFFVSDRWVFVPPGSLQHPSQFPDDDAGARPNGPPGNAAECRLE